MLVQNSQPLSIKHVGATPFVSPIDEVALGPQTHQGEKVTPISRRWTQWRACRVGTPRPRLVSKASAHRVSHLISTQTEPVLKKYPNFQASSTVSKHVGEVTRKSFGKHHNALAKTMGAQKRRPNCIYGMADSLYHTPITICVSTFLKKPVYQTCGHRPLSHLQKRYGSFRNSLLPLCSLCSTRDQGRRTQAQAHGKALPAPNARPKESFFHPQTPATSRTQHSVNRLCLTTTLWWL